jgi:hypothetical protein
MLFGNYSMHPDVELVDVLNPAIPWHGRTTDDH